MSWYERQYWLHALNPCDVDAHALLKPIGRALAQLTTYCPCCTGARILIAVVLTYLMPTLTLTLTTILFVALVVKEIFKPTEQSAHE